MQPNSPLIKEIFFTFIQWEAKAFLNYRHRELVASILHQLQVESKHEDLLVQMSELFLLVDTKFWTKLNSKETKDTVKSNNPASPSSPIQQRIHPSIKISIWWDHKAKSSITDATTGNTCSTYANQKPKQNKVRKERERNTHSWQSQETNSA